MLPFESVAMLNAASIELSRRLCAAANGNRPADRSRADVVVIDLCGLFHPRLYETRLGDQVELIMPELRPEDDPPPVSPIRPGREDCCRGSCDPCVFDLYEEAMERYRAELQAWQKRKGRRQTADDRSASR